MSDKPTCQFLGCPKDGLFYYRNLKTNALIAVDSDDEVDRFIGGDFDKCPPHIVIDESREIVVHAQWNGSDRIALNAYLPYSDGEEQKEYRIGCQELGWLLDTQHLHPSRVRFGDGLEEVRQLFMSLFISTATALCGAAVDSTYKSRG